MKSGPAWRRTTPWFLGTSATSKCEGGQQGAAGFGPWGPGYGQQPAPPPPGYGYGYGAPNGYGYPPPAYGYGNAPYGGSPYGGYSPYGYDGHGPGGGGVWLVCWVCWAIAAEASPVSPATSAIMLSLFIMLSLRAGDSGRSRPLLRRRGAGSLPSFD